MVKFFKEHKWLIGILILAAIVRIVGIDYLELFGDEIDAGYQSYSLMTNASDYKGHFLPTYMQSFSEWRAPGMMYAMVPFIKIFGLNEWGVRLPAALWGLMSIVGFYCLLQLSGINKKTALWSTFFLAIAPWHIQYSRAAFEITLLASEIIWGTFLLIKGIKTKRNIFIIGAGLVLSLGFYTYNTANIYVPLICLLTLIYFKAHKKQCLVLIISGIIFSLPIGYQILFGHASERFKTISIFNNKEVIAEVNEYRNKDNISLVSKVFYNKLTMGGKRILFNYSNAFGSNFLFYEGDVTFRHSLHQVGNLYWIWLPVIIIGLISANKYWLWLLMITPIPSSLTIDGYNHATRLLMMIFPLVYLAGLGMSKVKNIFKVGILTATILSFGFYQYYYWNFYRSESWRWWHVGYKEAMNYISDNKTKYAKVIMDNTYEPTVAKYLFWNKIDPKDIFNMDDKMDKDIDGFQGFCMDERTCFVNYGQNFKVENLKSKTLYLISQDRNVGGDWDWTTSAPEGIKVLKTVRNYEEKPIFYLVEKSE